MASRNTSTTWKFRTTPHPARRRAIVGTAVGNFVEWYDFTIYSYAATLIAKQFFPRDNYALALMETLAIFSVAFLMRPIGGLVVGWYADRWGRRPALIMTLRTMALATTAIGVIPPYQTIGVWAPLLLVMSRLIQGISAGGEAGTASSLILEYAPAGYRGRFASVQIMTMTAALLTGSALEALLSALMPLSAADQWGWRLPFLLAAPLGAVTLYARSRVAETPRFQVVMNDTDQAVRGAMARTPRRICFTVAVQAVGIVGVYTFLVFMPLYLETLGLLSRPEALLAGAVATGVSLAAAWPFGALSDRYGRRAVLLTGALAHLVCAYPLCLLLGSGKLPWILLAQAVAGVVSASVAAPGVAMLSEQFPTRFRATGVGLSYSITVSLFGGTTPLVAAALIGATGALTALAAYLGAVALLSAGAMIGLESTHKGPLRDFWATGLITTRHKRT